MTYSSGGPGYQPAQPPGSYGAPNPSFVKATDDTSKLPQYLQVAVVVLGVLTYLASFGPMLTASDGGSAGMAGRAGMVVPLVVLAALLAAAGLLPKAKNYAPIVAVIAVFAALLAIKRTIVGSDTYSIGWAFWLVLAFVIVQAIAAVGVLLLEAGVVTAPAPRPKYDPYAPYGLPPGGGYYGQQAAQHGPTQHQPGYQSYGGYPPPPAGRFGAPSAPPAPSGPSTGGFGTGPQRAQQGPPTPPTGFPSFGPPPSGGSPTTGAQGSASGGTGPQSQSGQGPAASASSPSEPTS